MTTSAKTNDAPPVHRRAIIVDGHCDTPYRLYRHNLHLDEHDPEAQTDLKTLLQSGITASFFVAYVPPAYANRGAAKFAHTLINLIESEAGRNSDVLSLVTNSEGIRAAKRADKVAI